MPQTQPKYRKLYVSGRLDLISVSGPVGLWLHFDDRWYRELDAAAFLWLRSRVDAARESSNPPAGLPEAEDAIAWIRELGIFWGAFSESEINPAAGPDPDWQWMESCPRWAETADF